MPKTSIQATAEGLPKLTRRVLLSATPAALAAASLPAIDATPEEVPVDRVNRLAAELAEALDEWQDGRWMARVMPESKGIGYPVMFESLTAQEDNSKRRTEHLNELLQLMNAHAEAMDAYDKCEDVAWNDNSVREAIDSRISETRNALLVHRCKNMSEVQMKVAFMSTCKSFYDWDDLDRVAIIKSLDWAVQA
jgi:hypothetical protein